MFQNKSVFLYVALVFSTIIPLQSNAQKRPLGIEIIMSDRQEQEVWSTDGNRSKLGVLRRLKRGTQLFHWQDAKGKLTSEIKTEGKISDSVMNLLLNQEGVVGGGFYVSTNPIDSGTYGNTLIIVTLPQDMILLKVWPYAGGNTDFWQQYYGALKQAGILALGNDQELNWLTIIDAAPLTHVEVATPESMSLYQFTVIPEQGEMKKFMSQHPDFAQNQNFQNLYEMAQKYSRDLGAGGATARTSVKYLLRYGTQTAQAFVNMNWNINWIDSDLLQMIFTVADRSLFLSRAQELFAMPDLGSQAKELALCSSFEDFRSQALYLDWTANPSETKSIFEKVKACWNNNPPTDVQELLK